MKNVTFRATDKMLSMLTEINTQPSTAASAIIETFVNLRRTIINQLKGMFTREELVALLSGYNGLIPTWDMLPSVELFIWHTQETEKYEAAISQHGADPAVLLKKIESLTSAQVTILQIELWAFWNHSETSNPELEPFIERFK